MCSNSTIMNGYVLAAILLTPILNYEYIHAVVAELSKASDLAK